MKCQFCGTKAKKSDELCPECGKYLSKKAIANAIKSKSDSEVESDFGRKLKFFDCKDYGSSIMTELCAIGIFLIVFTVYVIYKNYDLYSFTYMRNFIIKSAFFILLCVLVILTGAGIYLTLKKCYICVCENGFYGIRPRLFRRCERFEIYYKDIDDFYCKIPATTFNKGFFFRSIPRVVVVVGSKKYTFCCLDSTESSLLASCIRESIPERNNKRR